MTEKNTKKKNSLFSINLNPQTPSLQKPSNNHLTAVKNPIKEERFIHVQSQIVTTMPNSTKSTAKNASSLGFSFMNGSKHSTLKPSSSIIEQQTRSKSRKKTYRVQSACDQQLGSVPHKKQQFDTNSYYETTHKYQQMAKETKESKGSFVDTSKRPYTSIIKA